MWKIFLLLNDYSSSQKPCDIGDESRKRLDASEKLKIGGARAFLKYFEIDSDGPLDRSC